MCDFPCTHSRVPSLRWPSPRLHPHANAAAHKSFSHWCPHKIEQEGGQQTQRRNLTSWRYNSAQRCMCCDSATQQRTLKFTHMKTLNFTQMRSSRRKVHLRYVNDDFFADLARLGNAETAAERRPQTKHEGHKAEKQIALGAWRWLGWERRARLVSAIVTCSDTASRPRPCALASAFEYHSAVPQTTNRCIRWISRPSIHGARGCHCRRRVSCTADGACAVVYP